MDVYEAYVRARLEEYRTFRTELRLFTVMQFIAYVVAWGACAATHLMKQPGWGRWMTVLAVILAAWSIGQCHEKIMVLRRVANQLIKINSVSGRTDGFEYDRDLETNRVRQALDTIAKLAAAAVVIAAWIP